MTPEIIPVMIGTAGHVDHGKTALVKLLTGCETDTLKEEKERGMSIDLGFAPCILPGNQLAGIIDVPGHEDFIKNMVAGASSIDLLFFVIAADEGIMPQTVEHFKIIKLIATPKIIIVLTKLDLIEKNKLSEIKEDIKNFINEMGFNDLPIIPVSNITGEGFDELRSKLSETIKEITRKQDLRLFRMNIERVFSLKGHGTVVTGIPTSGKIKTDDTVILHPEDKKFKIRAIQNYKFSSSLAVSNVCTAINLKNLEAVNVRRGMTITLPDTYKPTNFAVIWVENTDKKFVLSKKSKLKFHSGTSNTFSIITLINKKEIYPEQDGFAVISLKEPVVLANGDRFILRSVNPPLTIGGGIILSTGIYKIKKSEPETLERLNSALDKIKENDYFTTELLAGPKVVISQKELARITYSESENAAKIIKEAQEKGDAINLGAGGFVVKTRISEAAELLELKLAAFHKKNQYTWGMEPVNVCQIFEIEAGNFNKLIEILNYAGNFSFQFRRLALKSFNPPLKDHQKKLKEIVYSKVVTSGAKPPAIGNLKMELNVVNEFDFQIILNLLIEEDKIKIIENNIFDTNVLKMCRQSIYNIYNEKKQITIGDFRNATNLSRNLSVPVLELFDAEGLTKRQDNFRVLLKRS